jgi:hypothetical protein
MRGLPALPVNEQSVEAPDIVAALLAKRAEIQKAIAQLQHQERRHEADMAQLDATTFIRAEYDPGQARGHALVPLRPFRDR